jgi:ABC-type polysaccharide/polyol phosphate export permease
METLTGRPSRGAFAELTLFPRNLVRNWFVITSLVRRELKSRYLNSAIGAVWSLITPLVMLAVYVLVFVIIFRAKFGEMGASDLQSAFYIYAAMTPWLAFAEALTRSSNVVIENSNLIKKVAFPSEVLPLYVVLYTTVNEVLGFVILLAAHPVLGEPLPGTVLLLYPAALFLRVLFTAGLCYLLAALNVFIRDVGQLVGLVTMLWMFLTPIFYDRNIVERAASTKAPWLITAMEFNPWYYIVSIYRSIFLAKERIPPLDVWLKLLAIGLVTFAFGYTVYMKSKSKFADEI